jgi:hypothetical protein
VVRVIDAELKDDYKIYVEFNDGIKGIIDFKKKLEEDHRVIIRELLNEDLFKTMKVNLHTLCWDNEVDFAPEYLHDRVETGKEKTFDRLIGMFPDGKLSIDGY